MIFIDDVPISDQKYNFNLFRQRVVEDSLPVNISDTKHRYVIELSSIEDVEMFGDLKFFELDDIVVSLKKDALMFKAPFIILQNLTILTHKRESTYPIGYRYFDWSGPFTLRDFSEEVRRLYNESFDEPHDESVRDLGILFDEDAIFKDAFTDAKELVKDIFDNAFDNLYDQRSHNVAKFEFDFPEHVKFACEQYLVYFGQFLKDIGENVNVELRHAGDKTLFSVIPEDQDIGLSKIHEALSIYLKISESRDDSGALSLAETRMRVIISGYQSQIISLQAENQARNMEVQAAKLIALNQQQLISNQSQILLQQGEIIATQAKALLESSNSQGILVESLKSEQEESEDVVAGLVKVKPYDLGPIQLDIPSAFRRLKEIFGKQDDVEQE
ncbi:hypothetical protein GCM10008949_09270 [Deinococcus humi]|nr:hypothetical protein GCM10008949_09270 [Deinococcus humi]